MANGPWLIAVVTGDKVNRMAETKREKWKDIKKIMDHEFGLSLSDQILESSDRNMYRMKEAPFECLSCGCLMVVIQDSDTIQWPASCINPNCSNKKKTGFKFRMDLVK
jgi:DNA replicative helicase MCM subunit Mcm2 (Cdc46/Mcm family)